MEYWAETREVEMTKTMLVDDVCYKAIESRDPRFDGLFFIAVRTTGIYCRAVCTCGPAKRENIRFYATAAAAEADGFRPCLRCRPELAPGVPASIDSKNIALRAAELIRDGAVTGGGIARLASKLAVSERQLRRLFEAEYGVSPAEYRNSCRLLLAKSLLTDTDLPITRVAFASGFSSLRRMNDAFLRHYSMSPRAFRKTAGADTSRSDRPIAVRLGYRPPYRFDLLLHFFALHAVPGVELVEGDSYYRTVSVPVENKAGETTRVHGWIRVQNLPQKNSLALTLSSSLLDVLPVVLGRIRRVFDVDCIPSSVEEGLKDFHSLVSESCDISGIRLAVAFDGFQTAVQTVLLEKHSPQETAVLMQTIAETLGSSIETPVRGLETVFPAAEQFCSEGIGKILENLGVDDDSAATILALAKGVVEKAIVLEPGADVEEMRSRLSEIQGLSPDSIQYLLLRAYAYPDAFPAGDKTIREAFADNTKHQLAELSEAWRPWRSYGVMSLWQQTDGLGAAADEEAKVAC
ncbi:MAG: DNA-3-methyladenine glycosylase 2 family protein [Coriobacteriia bacterium]